MATLFPPKQLVPTFGTSSPFHGYFRYAETSPISEPDSRGRDCKPYTQAMPARLRQRKAAPARSAPSSSKGNRGSVGGRAVLDPILTMNSGGIIQSASDSVEQVFGWTPTELLGRNISSLIPEPRRSALDRYLDRYRRGSRDGVRSRAGRFDALRKDGNVISIELSVSRADLPTDESPFFVGIVRDVSRRIDVAAGSEEDRSRLENLIVEQTRALATANLRLHLADRLAALGTLAAGLGHDVNNVLLPVRARLNALESAQIPAAARAHVGAIRRSLAFLQKLSDGLHYLSQDAADAADGEGTTDLGQWWGQVGELLKKAVPKHVVLKATLPRGLPLVRVAPHWLTQAVLNLIVNAGESIPKSRRRPPGRVRVWAHVGPDGATVRLGVTDNGVGMSHDVRRRAFDLFFTTKSRSMGTGLGLPLVRKVATRAGGTVELKSLSGKGTTAVLVLPAVMGGAARRGSSARGALGAAVSVRDGRTGALVWQVLHGAGIAMRAMDDHHPGKSDLWVTEPTRASLAVATRWRNGRSKRAVVLLGAPPRRQRGEWEKMGATIIEAVDDFEAIREAIGRAVGRVDPACEENHGSRDTRRS